MAFAHPVLDCMHELNDTGPYDSEEANATIAVGISLCDEISRLTVTISEVGDQLTRGGESAARFDAEARANTIGIVGDRIIQALTELLGDDGTLTDAIHVAGRRVTGAIDEYGS